MNRYFAVFRIGYCGAWDEVCIISSANVDAVAALVLSGVPQAFFECAELGDFCDWDKDSLVMRMGQEWTRKTTSG